MISPEVADAACGIALCYSGQSDDEYSTRLVAAMESSDMNEIEHVTALMICLMYGREELPEVLKQCNQAWRIILEANRA